MKVMVLVLVMKGMIVVKDNSKIDVRMAGYTSLQGTEDIGQEVSESKADAVRDYLLEKGIAPEKIIIISYNRTKPAVYELTPGGVNSKKTEPGIPVLF